MTLEDFASSKVLFLLGRKAREAQFESKSFASYQGHWTDPDLFSLRSAPNRRRYCIKSTKLIWAINRNFVLENIEFPSRESEKLRLFPWSTEPNAVYAS